MRFLITGMIPYEQSGTEFLANESTDEIYYHELLNKGVLIELYQPVSVIGKMLLIEVDSLEQAHGIAANIPSALEGYIEFEVIEPMKKPYLH